MELRNEVESLSVKMFYGRKFAGWVDIKLTSGEKLQRNLSDYGKDALVWILKKIVEVDRGISKATGFLSGSGPDGHGWSFNFFRDGHPLPFLRRKGDEKYIRKYNLMIQAWWDAFEDEIRSAPEVKFDEAIKGEKEVCGG